MKKQVKGWVAIKYNGAIQDGYAGLTFRFQKTRPKAINWHNTGKIRFVSAVISYEVPFTRKSKKH